MNSINAVVTRKFSTFPARNINERNPRRRDSRHDVHMKNNMSFPRCPRRIISTCLRPNVHSSNLFQRNILRVQNVY